MGTTQTSNLPLDPDSTAALAATGLEYALVDPDGEGFEPFLRSVSRGFLGEEPSADEVESARTALRSRRMTGVFDRAGAVPTAPVATVDSWASELTVSPGRTLPLWSISAVTVAPTHRRRGIATAMLTGELRTAAAAGYALAGLTVTEATIYGRWGFSPAAWASHVTVDTRRAQWTGPAAPGRLDFVPRDSLPERLAAVHERMRVRRPGAVPGWEGRWRGIAGLTPDAPDAKKVRAVAYRDREGVERGILVYTIAEREEYTAHELQVRVLFADGDEALAALWRFALEHDLVGRVTAELQPAVPPVQWMISDRRAVRATLTDHHWLRVLDVPGALASRAYAGPLDLVLGVDDPLGFADGAWRVRIDAEGEAAVERVDAEPDVRMPVGSLASLLLGGVRATELAVAGLVQGEETHLAAIDGAFAPAAAPLLDIWY
ncbi:GNAT family N-acetyltransferase [Microbacterium testaceum]|uniref:GNAT family N-acetyltransferase n=1 Tax=Microbacterium testaceum TaxID=2033 RepID=UPI001D1718CF|nr:GNAT family N-acetyltransferase [Microbacterium testaceum]MCC4249234.1 GNAT family N-acetyltransferase [Microbacterium testaceum]